MSSREIKNFVKLHEDDDYKKVWETFNELKKSFKEKAARKLSNFVDTAYVSHYWKQKARKGTPNRLRDCWLGFADGEHLEEMREHEKCVQFEFDFGDWGIWIDRVASEARHRISEALQPISDEALAEYFKGIGEAYSKRFGDRFILGLYAPKKKSDWNEFQKSFYDGKEEWVKEVRKLAPSDIRPLVHALKQPKTGLYIGGDSSFQKFRRLDKQGILELEIISTAIMLLPLYRLLTASVVPPVLRRLTSKRPAGGSASSRRGKTEKLSQKEIDEAEDQQEQQELDEIEQETPLNEADKARLREELKNAKPSKGYVDVRNRRYKRDNKAISALKKYRGYECQIPTCKVSIITKKGVRYIEAAHIKSKPEKGSELYWNMLILCPNHHKEFDKGDRQVVSHTKEEIHFRLNGTEYTIPLGLD